LLRTASQFLNLVPTIYQKDSGASALQATQPDWWNRSLYREFIGKQYPRPGHRATEEKIKWT
jgi:hypothetical protein